MKHDLTTLCATINYKFRDLSLLKQALTHCSAGITNNERYEFLGDAILNFVIADALFSMFSKNSEGELSRLRATLVKGDTLAEIAVEINLGNYLILGHGEYKSGGYNRASILANTLEAVFAAVFLDGGFGASQQIILTLYDTRLADNKLQVNMKDPKTKLQEYLQSLKRPLPTYALLKVKGEEHEQIFYVKCKIRGIAKYIVGSGTNRRKAEQQAAKLAFKQLNQLPNKK